MSGGGDTERAASDTATLQRHYGAVARALTKGQVTPILGAGVNLAGRPDVEGDEWLRKYLPSGKELAEYLAAEYDYPDGRPIDLVQVAQYIHAMDNGTGPLYVSLREIFNATYSLTPVHEFLAKLPRMLRDAGPKYRPPVIVTTNYDDLMEKALEEEGEPFDVLVYAAQGPHEGRFCVRGEEGRLQPIAKPDEAVEIDPDERAVVLKIHGFVDRIGPDGDNEDSYVITEDHYIEYLARIQLEHLIPVNVLTRLRNTHFLFLGYALQDWNLRAILHELDAARRGLKWASWAIQLEPDELECASWKLRGVEIFDARLDDYVKGLSARLAVPLRKPP
jgi:hypothetical protein